MTTEYISMTGSVTGNERDGFKINHHWDGQRFPLKASAVRNGFDLAESDDFRVGVVENGKLASVWWMDEQIDEPAEELAAIAKEIGLTCRHCGGTGLIEAGGCNCGSPADVSVNFAHERLCGFEPCPNGCWDKLHPEMAAPRD